MFAAIGQRIGGLRWPFVIGQTLLLAAILMFAFSRSLILLIIARVIQGLSCGAVFTAGYPLLYDAFGSAQIGQVLGYTSMSLSLGFFVGPI
ncbi:MAG: MFS transporter, partial [Cytophagaceae bacterium]